MHCKLCEQSKHITIYKYYALSSESEATSRKVAAALKSTIHNYFCNVFQWMTAFAQVEYEGVNINQKAFVFLMPISTSNTHMIVYC